MCDVWCDPRPLTTWYVAAHDNEGAALGTEASYEDLTDAVAKVVGMGAATPYDPLAHRQR